jgi:RNA polymerase sigma-70 factor (ECF subfamily)
LNVADEQDTKDGGISIALLKQGDRGAFAQFVSRYQDMVFACCRAVGLSDADIEDTAAEAFLAAWQSIGKFNHNSKLSSWLWSITYHKAVDYRRKNSTAGRSLDAVNAMPSPHPSAWDVGENTETNSRVWQAVQRLSNAQAAVVVLFYREQKPVDEIAAILQIPRNTVKTHLHRARKELYNQLQTLWENEYVEK